MLVAKTLVDMGRKEVPLRLLNPTANLRLYIRIQRWHGVSLWLKCVIQEMSCSMLPPVRNLTRMDAKQGTQMQEYLTSCKTC